MPARRVLKLSVLIFIIIACLSASLPVVYSLAGSASLDRWPGQPPLLPLAMADPPLAGDQLAWSPGKLFQPVLATTDLALANDWPIWLLRPDSGLRLALLAGQAAEGAAEGVAKSAAETAADFVAGAPDSLAMVLAGNQIVAFYGKPGAAGMGILGRYSQAELAPLLAGWAAQYDALNGALGVVPAFYIIFGTCWPEGEIGYTSRAAIEDYIAFAAERGWLVIVDHQIGRYSVEAAMASLLPFLRFPNVHLALDPEWRTTQPMREIGSISAAEFNQAQALMQAYLVEHQLPGVRLLLVHQFHPRMLTDTAQVVAAQDRVVPVHIADGIGNPDLKRYSYGKNAVFTNLPYKGFKLFFESRIAGARWDIPLMTPAEVLALQPMPLVIMYQ
ncbi:MAG: hypothetical protein A2087_02305 [Spirochaetes bacterium GWD1_61_31]|nr:MAG: hypothetical protein A2Y37_00725 [Spirochaetes bacterium GWB1_60_80]OHD29482.1 MAG: hypothetical protein A2004_03770 [Spirochaetes bacterium GWC1_61_12]OHD44002.1 MAG: hypothetical protein A2087_02305 [Spirochaetes bacterium GWD1_61_31]OHD46186.1 MAG: hypothetical protein A2Y35_00800 [Spirochaetes bacterium GWE1_60_18]OHD60724.1 MAG: hypothetical protein A2Y32_07605 [Spirochaetes bacterium GWF1_60_12]HAP43885.1 hypothetical protein [Spirochaetaceae bacterium]